MALRRNFDIRNLVRELAENKVSALEVIREAISNAKDHGAARIWIRTTKDQRNEVSLLIADDGEGMDGERLEAFWGVGASSKTTAPQPIGYKGHGTKLYFDCRRLSVATRVDRAGEWHLTTLEMPFECSESDVPESTLRPGDALYREIEDIGLKDRTGTIIFIEQVRFEDRSELLSRREIESYCDWFTAVGDVRSGLFDHRIDFHRALVERHPVLDDLRPQDGDLRQVEVWLRVNGERAYFPLGQGPTARDKELLRAWQDDVDAFKDKPGVVSYGHRFADVYESPVGATRVRDDTSALKLTSPADWATEDGLAIVARVEGHRRQLQTYLEARWQGHEGIYGFEQRFGLWLCRDFIPVAQRNDLLRQALERASGSRLRFEINNLRNWKVFVNYQLFRPTANRNDISNKTNLEARVVDVLAGVLEHALRKPSFQDWVQRLRSATLERWKDREIAQMTQRLADVETWIRTSPKKDGIDPMAVTGLPELGSDHSLLLKAPRSEQELFYVYGLLSGRFEMPVHIIEYDASEGVDAIGQLRVPSLVPDKRAHVRVEFKLEVQPNNPIHHFFDAIDLIICWTVGRVGDIYEESSATLGRLRRRSKSVLSPPIDTNEIAYEADGRERVIPIVEISALFTQQAPARRARKV